MQLDLVKADMKQALLALHLKYADEEDGLRLMVKPTRSVFTARSYAAGKLHLVPASGLIQLGEASQPAPSGAVALGECVTHPTKQSRLTGHILRHSQVPEGKAPTRGFISPYWFLRTVAQEEDANLDVQVHTVTLGRTVAVAAKGGGKTPKHTETKQDFVLEIPVLVNRRALEPNEELLVFKAAAPKRPNAVTVLPEAKRGKSASSK